MTIMFVAYGIAGGLHAAVLTDFIQGVLTIVFSYKVFPIELLKLIIAIKVDYLV